MEELKVINVSIVLVTYNQLEYTQKCVQSIRRSLQGWRGYELIVVDNASEDGTREWLAEQEDIQCILNQDNRGFPAACNQGGEIARSGNDIFLLNNDTIVFENSIWNLHKALQEENVGAVGAVSNHAGGFQSIFVSDADKTLEEWNAYAHRNNVYDVKRHERRFRLIGFALMVRRDIWDSLGGMDEGYGIGNFEDDDLCLQIIQQGYDLRVCKDSFIYHAGGVSFKKNIGSKRQTLMQKNREYFEKKWGMDWKSYWSHDDKQCILKMLKRHPLANFSVLDVGCGSGAALLEIESRYPRARLYGTENDIRLLELAEKSFGKNTKYVETVLENPFYQSFDNIILVDVLEYLTEPVELLTQMKDWLDLGGRFIIGVKNRNYVSKNSDQMDREKDFHGYTLPEIQDMLEQSGLRTIQIYADIPSEQKMNVIDYMDSQIERVCYQYCFLADVIAPNWRGIISWQRGIGK